MVKQLPVNRLGVSLHMQKSPCSKRYETTHQVLGNPSNVMLNSLQSNHHTVSLFMEVWSFSV